MVTRRQRVAQAEAMGQSEPHTSLPPAARRQTHAPKGQGTPLIAAVGATTGTPDVDLATARPNQVVLYEDVEVPQGLPEPQNLSKYCLNFQRQTTVHSSPNSLSLQLTPSSILELPPTSNPELAHT